jgi:tetratricopeptide (TPR) repeat protein
MTVQLIHAASDTHLWAESYDRDWKETFSLASELSQNVAREVGLAVTPHSTKYVSPEAHDLYLRGRYFWFNDNYDRAEDYFQKSKDLQPDYAAAWTGIADIQTVKAVAAIEPSAKVRQAAEEAAHRAVDLDNLLPEAHNALAATYLFLEWDWRRAEEESRRALELNPNFAEGHHLRSYVLAALNRMDEALLEQKRGLDLDPFQRPWSLGATYIQLRRYDDAIRELEMRKEAQPENVWVRFTLFRAYGHKQMWADAAREFEQGVRLSGGKQAIEEIHSQVERKGPKSVLEFQLRDSLREVGKTYVPPVELASKYAWLGKKEETLKWLEAACDERAAWLVFVQDDPVYDFVHSEPRYQAIVKKMGLPPAF